jgi:hypothetical protein
MIRDIFGNEIKKDNIVAFALNTGVIALAKVDHVPVGIVGEPPYVLISPNQIPINVQPNGMVGGILAVPQPEEQKLVTE